MKNKNMGILITVAIALILSSSILAKKTKFETKETKTNKTVQITFKKDKLIEVAFLSVHKDKQSKLQNEYFKKVMPIAMEYGLKPLGKVKVNYSYSEFVKPQMIGFFEWPSEKKHQDFLKDKRFQSIKPIRDNALSFLRMGYFKVENDTQVEFNSGKLIEIYGMWFNPKQAHRMKKYFENVTPLITGKNNKYDVQFPLALKSASYGADTYQPESFGIAIWKSKESNNQFFTSSDYAKIKADKEAAINRLDVWQGEIMPN